MESFAQCAVEKDEVFPQLQTMQAMVAGQAGTIWHNNRRMIHLEALEHRCSRPSRPFRSQERWKAPEAGPSAAWQQRIGVNVATLRVIDEAQSSSAQRWCHSNRCQYQSWEQRWTTSEQRRRGFGQISCWANSSFGS